MNQEAIRDILIRAAKTFAQAFIAAWAVSGYSLEKEIAVAALSAAVSAAWNSVLAKKDS